MIYRTAVLAGLSLLAFSVVTPRLSAQHPSWTLERHLDLVRTIRGHIGVPATYQPRRTAWGHPDFEGAWTSDAVHGVPRDRPAQFGTRMFLTDAEFAEREAREAKTREEAHAAFGVGTAGPGRVWSTASRRARPDTLRVGSAERHPGLDPGSIFPCPLSMKKVDAGSGPA